MQMHLIFFFFRKLIIHSESHDVEVVNGQDNDDKRVYSTTYYTGGHDQSKKGRRKEVPFIFEVTQRDASVNILTKLPINM